MSLGAILALALGLSLDAMAVAAAKGCSVRQLQWQHVARVALFFGGFQALMPLIGWVIGARMGPFIEAWDHWVAFGMLLALGAHMLWEARSAGDEPEAERADFGWKVMTGLGIATSIDALAAGITLPMLGAPLVLSIASIGVVTAVMSGAGLFVGRRFGLAIGSKLDVLGGVVLIVLGCKILAEHTVLA